MLTILIIVLWFAVPLMLSYKRIRAIRSQLSEWQEYALYLESVCENSRYDLTIG